MCKALCWVLVGVGRFMNTNYSQPWASVVLQGYYTSNRIQLYATLNTTVEAERWLSGRRHPAGLVQEV